MRIRALEAADRAEWVRLRAALWPDADPAELAAELAQYLPASPRSAVLVAARPGGGLAGLIEVSLHDYVDGCSSSPVGYIEGWYVDPDARRRGLGRALVAAGEAWARALGCVEMGSDAELDNVVSHAAHAAVGYREVERVIRFARRIA